MQDLGYGKDYKYAHDYEDHIVDQQHLPKELARQTLLHARPIPATKSKSKSA